MSDQLAITPGILIDAAGNVAFNFAGNASHFTLATAETDTEGELALEARAAGGVSSFLDLVAEQGGVSYVRVSADSFPSSVLLLNSDDYSDFVQARGQKLTVDWTGVNLRFFIDGVLKKTL